MIFKYHGTECDHQGNLEKRAEPMTLLGTGPWNIPISRGLERRRPAKEAEKEQPANQMGFLEPGEEMLWEGDQER